MIRVEGLLTAALMGAALWGQTNEELFREYQFNFSLPGARTNAMGGAFIGLADDASASFANPAGLAFLRETSLQMEFRSRFLHRLAGALSGPTHFAYEQEERQFQNLSFLSVNTRFREWYLALFHYRFMDESQERQFVSRTLSGNLETISVLDVQLRLQGASQGIGLARRHREFKFGLSVAYARLEAGTAFTREQVQIRPEFGERFSHSHLDEADRRLAWTAGMLHAWKEWLSWGAVVRIHPTFHMRGHVEDVENGQTVRIAEFDIPFVVPDVYGFGTRWRPHNQLSLLLDWQYLTYSEIVAEGIVIVESPETDRAEYYTMKDIQEIHLGGEWLIPHAAHVYALRAGFYRNPPHVVQYIGADPVQAALFSRERSRGENHLTFGGGWAFQNRINLDFSANLWSAGREFSLSLIWRPQ